MEKITIKISKSDWVKIGNKAGWLKESKSPAWQRSEGKNENGGLNQKGRDSYNRETGGNLKAPVTESNPTGKSKKRKDSYCARACGQKKMHSIDCSKDPDKRMCKALKKWKCRCS